MKKTIDITVVGKPRMTQQDKWKKRPSVMKYRAFADELRLKIGNYPGAPLIVNWTAYLPMPKKWDKATRERMSGAAHRVTPDRDNIDKAILDALFPDDSMIHGGSIYKFWDDGAGPRLIIEIL